MNQDVKVDIHAVAKAARVSISTVSRTFNHPDLVNPRTRKRIDSAVKRLGYIRNRAAQAMHGKRSSTIGLIVPTIDHAIFGEVVQAFSDTVDEAGFTILMSTHGFDLNREYQVLRKLLEHRVDGVALIGLDHAEETYQLLAQQNVPVISMWNFDPQSRIPCVGANNRNAGMLAAEQLINAGHRRIATIFPDATQNDRARGRQEGATTALAQAGIVVPEHWQSQSTYSISEAKSACIEVLTQQDRPSALLCGNDVIAQGAIFAAHQLGMKLPIDLSVVGIGDFKGSSDIVPALTTIRIPAKRIGSLAGQRLIAGIREEEALWTREECELRVVERASVEHSAG
jgi:LacI family transcriptional regulator